MDQSEFESHYSLKRRCEEIGGGPFPPKSLQVYDHFYSIEKELREGKGMSKILHIREEYLETYLRVTSFFQFYGSNLESLTPDEIDCIKPIVQRLCERTTTWSDIFDKIKKMEG